MKFTQTHAVGGDETAPYDLSEYPVKVTDFIDEVLKQAIELIDTSVPVLEYDYEKPPKELFYSWVFTNGLR